MLAPADRAAALDRLARAQPAREELLAELEAELGAGAAHGYPAEVDADALLGDLLDLRGAALLTGKRPGTLALRRSLLNALATPRLRELVGDAGAETPDRAALLRDLASRRWREGGAWARAFVAAVGLPPVFAGRAAPEPVASVTVVAPHRPPPALKPFQVDLRDRLLAVLRGQADGTRAIVSLPTGGGKTRTAGEALCRLIDARGESDGAYYLWLAQSEELCEQAVACFEQLWAGGAYAAPLRIYRYFGGNRLDAAELAGGLVVAGIQQLSARLDARDPVVERLLSGLHAVVIDEAHRATSSSYAKLFAALASAQPGARVPVAGLTATPGRSGGETGALVRAFEGRLLTPRLEGLSEGEDPLGYFRDRGYLARPVHEVVATGYAPRVRPPTSDATAMSAQARLTYEVKLARELARADRRNALIVRRLAAVPQGTPTLVYACSTEHVRVLHLLLRRAGRSSAFLLGDTRRSERARIVEAFRRGEVEFLVNYGVLTTGFDAPRTRCIALTRPIFSEVLYEQIVGRGLRGPAFGGTPDCLILDFEDNLATFGDQRAYARFAGFWAEARRTEAAELGDDAPPAPRPPRRAPRRRSAAGPGQQGLF